MTPCENIHLYYCDGHEVDSISSFLSKMSTLAWGSCTVKKKMLGFRVVYGQFSNKASSIAEISVLKTWKWLQNAMFILKTQNWYRSDNHLPYEEKNQLSKGCHKDGFTFPCIVFEVSVATTVAERHGRNLYVVEQDSSCPSNEETEKTDQGPNVSFKGIHTRSHFLVRGSSLPPISISGWRQSLHQRNSILETLRIPSVTMCKDWKAYWPKICCMVK